MSKSLRVALVEDNVGFRRTMMTFPSRHRTDLVLDPGSYRDVFRSRAWGRPGDSTGSGSASAAAMSRTSNASSETAGTLWRSRMALAS
jgi:hypothetical protein